MRKDVEAGSWSTGGRRRSPPPPFARATRRWCEAAAVIPGDGEIIEGDRLVDESAITGESAPVIRESGGDRSAVTGGTKVLSDRIVVRITANPASRSSTG
jgi:K+-transporting ATPase ATPase B chain